eukprot:gnl/Dysnectes_brevis/4423_a5942_772.p1 GENE.gnl/Dysnectes_brevis/4423_a5942_772~~gnl/Dysnectes_brevis/4423_a5942_772.p1  ORF type:complete len:1338 (-),score=259.02 gnl/Dysnectes_brevis/4423_a5942_772:56-4069(-)
MTLAQRRAADAQLARREAREQDLIGGDFLAQLEQRILGQQEEQARRSASRRLLRRTRLAVMETADDVEEESEVSMDGAVQTEYVAVDLSDVRGTVREFLSLHNVQRTIHNVFIDFLQTWTVPTTGEPFYVREVRRLLETQSGSLTIDAMHLSAHSDPTRALLALVLDAPASALPLLDTAVSSFVFDSYPLFREAVPEIRARIFNVPGTLSLRELRSSHLNRLIQIRGVVTARTSVFPQMSLVFFDCKSCHVVIGPIMSNFLDTAAVTRCPKCQSKGPFKINSQQTQYRNYQRVSLQEAPGSVPAGRVPERRDIILLHDLIDSCRPGEIVTLTGIYTHTFDPASNRKAGFPVFKTAIEAIHINRENDSSLHLTDSDRDLIRRAAEQSGIGDRIVRSISPSIFGHEDIKASVAAVLFGGVAKRVGRHRMRGDINLLLMGDPGTAKSQFLKYVEHVAPRAVFATGKGASAVGLTAAVKRDPVSGEFVLQGGALVLADRGICCFGEGTEVLRGDGTVGLIEQVRVGDVLMGKDGGGRTVTSLASGTAPLYSIQAKHGTLPMGEPMIVNGDHILHLSYKNIVKHGQAEIYVDRAADTPVLRTRALDVPGECSDLFNISVKDWISLKTNEAKMATRMVLFADAFQTPAGNPVVTVPEDPSSSSTIGEFDVTLTPELAYLIGYWLGDGSSGSSTFCVKVRAQKTLEAITEIDDLDESEGTEISDRVESAKEAPGLASIYERRENLIVGFLSARVAEIHPSMRVGEGPWQNHRVGVDSCDGRKNHSPWIRFLRTLGFAEQCRDEPITKPLGSNFKRIPEAVLSFSVEHRAAFMAGLIDTDGHVSPMGTSFELFQSFVKSDPTRPTEWSPMLKRLAMSLGMLMSETRIKPTEPIRSDWLIWGFTPGSNEMLKKLNTYLLFKKFTESSSDRPHAEFEIERLPGPPKPFFGVNLDGDRLHVLPNLTVHHNCIDEIDKMSDQDRTSLHEAMEQQTISISKAGIVTTLQARCSVVAAANPIRGRYDARYPLLTNVNLTEPIISRFDLLCVVQDVVNPVQDERLVAFVARNHIRSHPKAREELTIARRASREIREHDEYIAAGGEVDADTRNRLERTRAQLREANDVRREKFGDILPPLLGEAVVATEEELVMDPTVHLPQGFLRKYIAYARTIEPRLQRLDMDRLDRLYVDLRHASAVGGSVTITARQVESIIRLSESRARMHLRAFVTDGDVDFAISLFLKSFVAQQKASIRRVLSERFSRYVSDTGDTNRLFLLLLQGMVREQEEFEELQRTHDAEMDRTRVLHRAEFETRAKERNLYDFQQFYDSQAFAEDGYQLSLDGNTIVKTFR